MRKILTSLLVLCFTLAGPLGIAQAETTSKPAKQVNPIIIIMGADSGTQVPDPNAPVQAVPDEKAKPVNPLDNGGPMPADLQEFFQHLFGQMQAQVAPPTPKQLEDVYKSVWYRINATYYDHDALKNFGQWKNKYDGKLTTPAELETAIKEMAGSLNDRWTSYTTSEEIKQSMSQHNAGLEPLGMMFKQHQDGSYVIDFMVYGTPAQKSDLRKGDTVKSINGKDLTGLTATEVEKLTLVKAGDEATIVAVIDGKDVTFTLKSAPADAPDFAAKLLPGNIAYVRLPSFESEEMVAGLVGNLQELYKASGGKLNGLVLDLRGNPGGVFDYARQVASLFLSQGVIVTSTTRQGLELHEERFSVVKAWPHDFGDAPPEAIAFLHTLETVPMTVLTDGSSASCSEILTGALKDNGRAVIVGQTTYGKGVGYQSGRHRAGGWLSVTSLSYLTPSGYNLANKGIDPDIPVAQPRGAALDVQLDAAVKAVKSQQMTPAKPQGQQSSPLAFIDPNGVVVKAAMIAVFFLAIVLFGVHLHMRAQAEEKKKNPPQKKDGK
jgi:carboxyl-terminal processing protease